MTRSRKARRNRKRNNRAAGLYKRKAARSSGWLLHVEEAPLLENREKWGSFLEDEDSSLVRMQHAIRAAAVRPNQNQRVLSVRNAFELINSIRVRLHRTAIDFDNYITPL